MRTAYAEWWFSPDIRGGCFTRYGTERDPFVQIPKDAQPNSLAEKYGYVIAESMYEAMRIDEEVFGGAA